jgi:hypothetical protein
MKSVLEQQRQILSDPKNQKFLETQGYDLSEIAEIEQLLEGENSFLNLLLAKADPVKFDWSTSFSKQYQNEQYSVENFNESACYQDLVDEVLELGSLKHFSKYESSP